MASDNEASCIADPNFAVICAFLQKFGTLCGVSCIDFIDLQKMIENTLEVPQPLLDLHLKLLRRIKKTVPIERWERVLAKVCHTYNNQDGWEIERFGYKNARISCKLRTLKTLLEMQFDCHTKFKNEINKLSADELRSQPLGRDKLGHIYWCQIDEDCQIRVYKEDPDEETWMLIAQDRDDLLSLISQLKENDSIMTGIEPVLNEDSNSLEIEKPILDTGQTDSSSNQPTADDKFEEKVTYDKIDEEQLKTQEVEETDKSNGLAESDDKEEPEVKNEHPPARQIGLRLKPMSELLNSPSAAEYQAEEEAKKKRTNEETVENPKPAKARKLTLMNSKPIKLTNKKHIEESSEEEGDVDEEDMEEDEDEDEDEEDMEDSDDVGEEIVEPIMYVKGGGQGKENCAANILQGSEDSSPIVGEEIREDVFYVFGEGSGANCQTGNENNKSEGDQNDNASSSSQATKSPIKLGMIIDSRTDKIPESSTKGPNKKNRWDVKVKEVEEAEKPKVSMFFFGPNTNATAGISFFASTTNQPKETETVDSNNSINSIGDESGTTSHGIQKDAPESDNNIDNLKNDTTMIKDDSKNEYEENHTNEYNEVTNTFEDQSLEIVSYSSASCTNANIENLSTYINNKITSEEEPEVSKRAKESGDISDNNLIDSKEDESIEEDKYSENKEADPLPISSITCDISNETRVEETIIEDTAVVTNLKSSITNSSCDTLDLSKKKLAGEENNLNKRDIITNSETSVVSDCNKIYSTCTIYDNTKENVIDSNTIITEMEIEEADNKDDSNLGDKSGENMDIETIDVGESKEKSTEIIGESKLTHSCLGQSSLILPTNHENQDTDKTNTLDVFSSKTSDCLPTDLSTINDSNISKNIEENPHATTIKIDTNGVSALLDTDKISTPVKVTDSNSKEFAPDLLKKDESKEDAKEEQINNTKQIIQSSNESDKTTVDTIVSQEDIAEANVSEEFHSTEKSDQISAEIVKPKILASIDSCVLSASDTTLNNIEPLAIVVTVTDGTTDSPSVVTEPVCVKKSIAPLTNSEDDAACATTFDIVDKSDIEKKVASPMQAIESVESIDADCHASSIDRDSEMDAAEDPFDNVGNIQDDPLSLAEEEQEDEMDEAEEEEIEEEEEEDEGEINPEDIEDEEVDGEDGLDEEEIEDEELEDEEEEEEEDPPVNDIKGSKAILIAASTKTNKAVDKKTSFSVDFNDSSDSLNLPSMLKEKLKKRQMIKQKQLKNQPADDSDEEVDDEEADDEEADDEEEDEEVDEEGDDEAEDESDEDGEEEEIPKSIPKDKADTLKGIRPPVKSVGRPLGKSSPPPVQIKKSTTSDLRKERKKKKTEIEILQEEIKEKSFPVSAVRQSRRIAQIKIREEAEKRKLEDLTLAQVKFESRKMFENSEKMKKGKLSSDEEYVADLDELKKKKKKKKHKHPKFDEHNPWKSSSGSSSSQEEEQEDDIGEDSDHDIRQRELKSDHEFSPESDLEDGTEVKPLKRARTVRKEDKSEEDDEEELDDTSCEKCGKFDHPEWILLCDGCDHGWHCSCLRPALLVIPEGDWFCPPCQHATLLTKLEEQLVDLDKRRSKQQIELRRKERLAYVGISLNNVLAAKDMDNKKGDKSDGRSDSSSSGSSGSSGSTDSSDSDEPIYQLRQRRQAHSYRFNDYDDLINSAIQDEEDPEDEEEAVEAPVGNQGRGKDIATIVNAEKEQREKEEGIGDTADKPPAKKVVRRKKKRKLNSLVVSSGEDGTSDEDFRGSSTDEDEDDLEFNEPLSSNSSYDSAIGRRRKKGGRGTRRSTRARWTRIDKDFINDDSDEELSDAPKRKRLRAHWSDDSDDLEDEDELSDRSWSKKRKRGSSKRSSSKSKTKKSKKKKKRDSDSDEPVKKKKRKIKFGGLNDTDEEEQEKKMKTESVRRTRGKKITYVDALGSDSEDEIRRRRAGIVEESEEEYVAEDDDGLEDEDGNEIQKDSDESDSNAPAKVHTKPVMKKGKGKGGIKRIKRAQGIEDELFPPLKQSEPSKEAAKMDTITSTTSAVTTNEKLKEDINPHITTVASKTAVTESVDPMQEINRNIECMDEKLMMEDPDYATKQLQMVAAQLDRKKKEDALFAAEAAAASEDMAKHRRGRKPKVIPYMSPAPEILQEKMQIDDVQENSNSPSPPIPPLGGQVTPPDGSPVKKRRGRGKGKKTLEKEAAAAAALAVAATALGKEDLGVPPQHQEEGLPTPKPAIQTTESVSPNIDASAMATAKLAIATPPQPFAQTEPAPSVITRMLQAPQTSPGPGTPPGSSSPAGPIPAGVPFGPGPPPHKYYGSGPLPSLVDGRAPPPPLRGAPHLPAGLTAHGLGGPYGPPPPMGGMNHRPYRGGPPPPSGAALPPHMIHTPTASHSPPVPPAAMYHHHHTIDASPSGGSTIQPMGGGSPSGPHHPRTTSPALVPPPTSVPPHLAVPPDRHSPSALGHTPPPPLIPSPGGPVCGPRYPPHAALQPPPRHHHMVPQHMQPSQHGMHGIPPRGVPGSMPPGAYPPGPPPPGAYYNTYPTPPHSSGIPPEDYHHHHHITHHPYGPIPPSTASQQQSPPNHPESPIPTTMIATPLVPSGVVSDTPPTIGGLKPAHGGTDDGGGQEDMPGASAGVSENQQDSSGEFGGLVSYFSSQREDDLDG